MHQGRSQAMGCSRNSPPMVWLDHTRDGSDVLEHLRIRIRIIPLLSIILVGGFLNILVSIVVCGWWNPFIVLHRRFNDMTGNDWTRKKRSKSILYSLVWIIQSTFNWRSWIETINSCNAFPITIHHISTDISSLLNKSITFTHPTRHSSEVTINNI